MQMPMIAACMTRKSGRFGAAWRRLSRNARCTLNDRIPGNIRRSSGRLRTKSSSTSGSCCCSERLPLCLAELDGIFDKGFVYLLVKPDALETDTCNLESTGCVKLRCFICVLWRYVLPASDGIFDDGRCCLENFKSVDVLRHCKA